MSNTRPTEVLDIIEVAPGRFRGVVEIEADATGWTVLWTTATSTRSSGLAP